MNQLITAPFEVKAADDGTFEGLAATFGDIDQQNDVIEKGAFGASIADPSAVKLLWQHDTREPIGVWESLKETDAGLEAKGRLLLDVQRGKEAHSLMKAGALNGLSIGFRVPAGGAVIDKSTRVRVLKSIDLHEISPVTFPANAGAIITAVKAEEITNEREFERFLRDAGLPKELATAVTLHGWKAACRRDAEGDEELAASLGRAIGILNDR